MLEIVALQQVHSPRKVSLGEMGGPQFSALEESNAKKGISLHPGQH